MLPLWLVSGRHRGRMDHGTEDIRWTGEQSQRADPLPKRLQSLQSPPLLPPKWERAPRLIQLIRRSKGLWMDDQVYFNRSFSEQAGEASVVFAKDVTAGGFEAAVDRDGCFRGCTQGHRIFSGQ